VILCSTHTRTHAPTQKIVFTHFVCHKRLVRNPSAHENHLLNKLYQNTLWSLWWMYDLMLDMWSCCFFSLAVHASIAKPNADPRQCNTGVGKLFYNFVMDRSQALKRVRIMSQYGHVYSMNNISFHCYCQCSFFFSSVDFFLNLKMWQIWVMKYPLHRSNSDFSGWNFAKICQK
jgi:hypothetical protein